MNEMKAELENISEKATTYLINGEYDKAIDCFTEILKEDSEHPLSYIYLGMAYYRKGDYEEAIEKLTKGINLAERFKNYNTFDPTVLTKENYQRVFRNKKGKFVPPTQKEMQTELTARKIKEDVNSLPIMPEAYFFRADAYFKKGSLKQAITDYNMAFDLGTNNPYAYIGIACVYSYKGEFKKSIEYCTKAIELDPELFEAYTNRALAYMHIGNNDCAEKDIQKARELNPDFIENMVYSGQICLNKFEYDNAIKYFDNVIDIDDKNINAFIGRGVAYLEKKEYKKALENYKRVLYLNPDCAEAYRGRGRLFFEKNDMSSAIEDFTKAIKINPNDPETFINRGKAYQIKKEFEKAIKDYDQAINLDPERVDAYFFRSITHYQKGIHFAMIDCEHALHLKSDFNEAQNWIMFLNEISKIGLPENNL
jgi:tetratricopeptide (TPR) repeat protein